MPTIHELSLARSSTASVTRTVGVSFAQRMARVGSRGLVPGDCRAVGVGRCATGERSLRRHTGRPDGSRRFRRRSVTVDGTVDAPVLALACKSALFAVSDDGARTWARCTPLPGTCRAQYRQLQTYLTVMPRRIVDMCPMSRIDALISWNLSQQVPPSPPYCCLCCTPSCNGPRRGTYHRAVASMPTECSGATVSLSRLVAFTPKENSGALALAAGARRQPRL